MKKKPAIQKKQEIKLETLTLKDVIETLAVYDVEHCRFPHNYIADFTDNDEIHGLVLDDKKLILIDYEQCIEVIREAVIHELIHAKHYRKGDLKRDFKYIEKIVKAETVMIYEKLYGVKP